MFDWADVRLLYLRELRSALRERNIVVNSILLPIFLYPLLLWLAYSGVSFVSGQTEGFVSRVLLQELPAEHQDLGADLDQDEQIALVNSENPAADIETGSLDVWVKFLPSTTETGAVDDFTALLTYDKSKDRSVMARSRIEEKIRLYRYDYLEREAQELGIAPAELQRFYIRTKNMATSRQMGQFLLGLMLPLFLIIMLNIGCIYPAIDSTAGEREKSTWETLMTAATSRGNIVFAKYLYVATMASVAGILNVAAMLFSVRAVLTPLLGERTDEFSFQIAWTSVPLILLVTVLLALFVAAGMMILASFARTFKEGQSLVSPFYVAIFVPALFLQIPGIEFTPGLALIPVVNVVMVFREAIAGVFQWHLIAITLAVELSCVSLALWLATTILRYEDFLLGSFDGSFGKFFKERLIRRRRGGSAHE